VDAFTAGVGWAPSIDGVPVVLFAVGVSVQVLRGAQNLLHSTRFVRADSTVASIVAVNELAGTRLLYGFNVRPTHWLDLAMTYRGEVTLDGDFVREGDPDGPAYFASPADSAAAGSLEIEYPRELGLGIAYRPRAKVRTTIRAEASWTDWSDFRHGLWSGLELDDVWSVRVGLEHVFYNGMPVRFGFHYQPSPQNEQVATTAFTFGGGLDLGPLRADLGFEFSNRDYRFDDLFDDAMFGGNTRTRKDLVDESALTVYGTVSYVLPGLGG
jgi:long-subunit fatty acid transport protein